MVRTNKNQGRLRGFIPQGLSNEPYNTHQQQIKHTTARFGLSPQILSLGRVNPISIKTN
jgi:hypothetical protein